MFKNVSIFFLLSLAFLGCKTEVQIPSYIQISSYKTKVNGNLTSTENQNFADMLVYANGQTYGIYPLGSKIPILTSGSTSFLIRAVVEINGVGALRADYEVMHGCDTVITVQPGEIKTVVPTFEYYSTAVFEMVNDFEGNTGAGPAIAFESGNCGSCLTDKTSGTYTPGYGDKGKCICLKSDADTNAFIKTASTISLPAGGVGVYMEFDYQSNVEIDIYIAGADGSGNITKSLTSVGGVFPTTVGGWKKVYIDLTEEVSTMQTGFYYLYFGSAYNPAVGANLALIDNIRVVSAQ